ncbi:MAG: hypothetical protein ACP5M4_00450 [Acidobacteriaceae bacterium]
MAASSSKSAMPIADPAIDHSVVAQATWHSLAWLVFANLIGVWIAILLLYPGAGNWIAPLSYGRWMPAHLDLQLYGWISLPLVGWAMRVYRADRGTLAPWSKTALVLWSLALTLGTVSWLGGHTTGKLFLDWTGYVRVFFPASILYLWGVLAVALARDWSAARESRIALAAKLAGLVVLLVIPFLIYIACNPNIYPPVNPATGGPTGASQLESVLVTVLILFLVPYGVTRRTQQPTRWLKICWILFALEAILCISLGRYDASNSNPAQYLGLATVLVWAPLLPKYYSAFVWRPAARIWLQATYVWWTMLLVTGWIIFLPGVLDRFKFTDGLVGHSLMAMAGFVTTLLILLLVMMLGEDGDVFDSRWAFWAWQFGTFAYVAIMFYAGWIEGAHPAFTMVPGPLRNAIYWLRLVLGVAMTAGSINWFYRLTRRMRKYAQPESAQQAKTLSGHAVQGVAP